MYYFPATSNESPSLPPVVLVVIGGVFAKRRHDAKQSKCRVSFVRVF